MATAVETNVNERLHRRIEERIASGELKRHVFTNAERTAPAGAIIRAAVILTDHEEALVSSGERSEEHLLAAKADRLVFAIRERIAEAASRAALSAEDLAAVQITAGEPEPDAASGCTVHPVTLTFPAPAP